MKKLLTLVAALCLITPAPVGLASPAVQSPIQLDLNEDGTPEYLISVERRFSSMSIEQETYQHIAYTHYLFREAGHTDATFQLTIAKTPQQDAMFFARQGETMWPMATTVTIQANETGLAYRYVENKDQETFLGEWTTWQSAESTAVLPLRPVYMQGNRLHARLGPVNVFEPQGHTVLKQINRVAPQRILNQYDTRCQFQLPGNEQTVSETWGILTHRPLVNWAFPRATDNARKIDIDTFRKLLFDGLYDVTPLTYSPSSKESYYRNPANISGLYHVNDASQAQYGSLVQVILTHLAYRAVNEQNEQGYWPTYPQSTWLFTDYQIDAKYFDNRRNADNATFLLRFNRQYPDPLFEESLKKWEAFLYYYIDQTGLQTSNQGYLIPDYVDSTFTHFSHTALNHQMAIINYLLESNLYNPDETKRRYIQALLQGIEDTQDRWIKPDSDLYYALYRDLRPHSYPDYHSLTLEDMMLTQSLLRQNHLQTSQALDKLIQSKQAWMEVQRLKAAP
ncbi:hypothetical protein LOK74_21270 [Brevibacillus humidisoli]|uniref:hypothetical protein n=1 Tax=Brevibacillus humidisoli TaxID=2895522 RepID=UPI001E65533D|nr:hypothetical protein [Brevibacillus humidisoli]UFJ40525.1 hypothetical protein LOK74_21270 [Brevibacillus humidisoli]